MFGDRGSWKNTMRLALPIAMQNLLICPFTLVDTIMAGQLGTAALAAVGDIRARQPVPVRRKVSAGFLQRAACLLRWNLIFMV